MITATLAQSSGTVPHACTSGQEYPTFPIDFHDSADYASGIAVGEGRPQILNFADILYLHAPAKPSSGGIAERGCYARVTRQDNFLKIIPSLEGTTGEPMLAVYSTDIDKNLLNPYRFDTETRTYSIPLPEGVEVGSLLIVPKTPYDFEFVKLIYNRKPDDTGVVVSFYSYIPTYDLPQPKNP